MSTQRCTKVSALIILAAVAPLSNGCHRAPWEQAARSGTLTELTQSVNAARQSHDFSRAELEGLAYVVAERESLTARDPQGNAPLEAPDFSELADCTRALTPILERRAERDDDTAAATKLSLVEAGTELSNSTWLRLRTSRFGWARAVAARASSRPERMAYRTQALADGDPRVRHAALRSCIEAPAKEHWEALVALLRAAPDAESRALAARAIGILGGDDAYRILLDVWPRATVELKISLVNALAQRPTFDAGGRERLIAIALGEPGIVGVAAAVSLATGSSTAAEIGHSRITRALTIGSPDEQRLALGAATWSRPEQAEPIVRLGLRNSDPIVRTTALGRWLERADHVWAATTLLRELSDEPTPQALLARHLLAEYGDRKVIANLTLQQRYANAEARQWAAKDLLRLGDWANVARALSDDSPAVRLKTACLVLTAR